MGQIGSWNGIVFEVSPNVVRGYTGLSIEGGSQTEEKVSDKYAYVQRKNSTPTSVNIDVYLNAYLGCNVRDEAMAFIKAATDGAKNYFYVAGKKLVECQLMLVSAKATEVTSTPTGEWTSCKIALTMKQCEKYSGGSSGGGGGGGSSGGGKKTSQPKKETVKQQSWVEKTVDAVKTGVSNVVNAAKNVVGKVTNAIKNVASKAASTGATAKKAEFTIAKKVSASNNVTTAAKKATTTKKATTVQKPAAKTASTARGKIKAIAK